MHDDMNRVPLADQQRDRIGQLHFTARTAVDAT